MARLPELTAEQYLEIEEALANNARGRAFLRMRDDRSRVIAANDVQRIVKKLRDDWRREDISKRDDSAVRILREELRGMSSYIDQTRREIAALRPADAGANRIIAATGELDAIVSATERATSDILNGAERIQALSDKLPRDGDVGQIARDIEGQVTEILTACSFQDITGQRTTKVVNTLRYIEQRVNSMIEIWGTDGGGMPAVVVPMDTRPDAHLMHGPTDGGPSQSEIDALLAKLDANSSGADAPAETTGAVHGRGNGNGNGAQQRAMPPAPEIPSAATSSQSDIDALFS
jgi:chemotaxis regulatin CheY-phosphate phosphatase CheZ